MHGQLCKQLTNQFVQALQSQENDIYFLEQTGNVCISSVGPGNEPTDPITLGTNFMRDFYTVFTLDPETLDPLSVQIALATNSTTDSSDA